MKRASAASAVARMAAVSCLALLAIGAVAGAAAGAAGAAGAARAVAATGDWGYSPLFMEITPSKGAAPLTMPLRLECFSAGGCTADQGLALGPRDSYGRTIHFTGTSATHEPLVTSGGATVGSCKMDPSPAGEVSCQSTSDTIRVPDHGWVGTAGTITYTAFKPAKPGEPLASDDWSDNPTGNNPGNKTDNDSQLILTPPVANPIWVFMNPTAEAFAAGDASQTEQVGLICASEGSCAVKAKVAFTATLSPSAVYYPVPAGQTRLLSGDDIDYACAFSDSASYSGRGSDRATCEVATATIIDHYGSAVLALPIRAVRSAYPQKINPRLTLAPVPARGTTGESVFTDLAIVAGLRIATAPTLPGATVGQQYSVTLHGRGGVPTARGLGSPVLHHYWTLATGSGTLPPGLVLGRGVIAGTPTKVGSYRFQLILSDGQGDHVDKDFTLHVAS